MPFSLCWDLSCFSFSKAKFNFNMSEQTLRGHTCSKVTRHRNSWMWSKKSSEPSCSAGWSQADSWIHATSCHGHVITDTRIHQNQSNLLVLDSSRAWNFSLLTNSFTLLKLFCLSPKPKQFKSHGTKKSSKAKCHVGGAGNWKLT